MNTIPYSVRIPANISILAGVGSQNIYSAIAHTLRAYAQNNLAAAASATLIAATAAKIIVIEKIIISFSAAPIVSLKEGATVFAVVRQAGIDTKVLDFAPFGYWLPTNTALVITNNAAGAVIYDTTVLYSLET